MDAVITFLEGLNLWWWLGLAGLLLIGELITGTTYLLWPAAAAFLVGLLTMIFASLGWPWQFVIFAAIALAFLWAGDRWVRPRLKAGSDSGLNTRATYLVGQRATVVSASGATGRVRAGDTEWPAESLDGSALEVGQSVTVSELRGTTLVVQPG
ncbi:MULTISPECIES: NfeD family protein [Hyphobacterium]|uniref:NfeD family protein n=1 Tax=Hyphobacterium vulgare TaxID=1736751 RepID=A0ABV6ZYX3_9PROT